MTKYLLFLLMGSSMCWGQQSNCSTNSFGVITCAPASQWITSAPWITPAKSGEQLEVKIPQPLKCGKYQHVEKREIPYEHGTVTCPADGDKCACIVGDSCAQNYCADDTHTLTEREWQELMERLKTMQKLLGITEKRK